MLPLRLPIPFSPFARSPPPPPSDPSSFHTSLVPISRPVDRCLCARGPTALSMVMHHIVCSFSRRCSSAAGWGPPSSAAGDAHGLVRRGGCGAGLDVPEPYSPAFAMWGDTPSSARALNLTGAIRILEGKNASTHIACWPFRLSIVNEVRLCLLLAPTSTHYSSPSDPFPPLLFLDLPFLPLPLLAPLAQRRRPINPRTVPRRSSQSISTAACAVRIPRLGARAPIAMDRSGAEGAAREARYVGVGKTDEGARWEPVGAFHFESLFLFFPFISIGGPIFLGSGIRGTGRAGTDERVCTRSSAGDGVRGLP
ncbi:hypothetical protein B0H13DRAFT_2680717 [Mycena leptocephala]|nr:hypothetical protein B0H13DRAFT_2680717 [Mycena leptocephala]